MHASTSQLASGIWAFGFIVQFVTKLWADHEDLNEFMPTTAENGKARIKIVLESQELRNFTSITDEEASNSIPPDDSTIDE